MRSLLKNKRSFELPFSWIFAIIAGTVILLIAIYATVRIVTTSQYIGESEAGKQLSTYITSVANGISNGYKPVQINLKKETRIYSYCDTTSFNSPYFGRQVIGFAEESGFLKKWSSAGANISINNKYVFSDRIEQGKKIYVFSKPFSAGFRVDDLIFMTMKDYCFVSAPSFIQTEMIDDLEMKNVNVTSSVNLCAKNNVKVCFGFSDAKCNISVYGDCNSMECENQYETGYVEKNGKTMNYYGSLIYAAIFSSPENYGCNLQRLGNKIYELGKIYDDKAALVKQKGCDSVVEVYLMQLMTMSKNLTSSRIKDIYDVGKAMDEQNCGSNCQIYYAESC